MASDSGSSRIIPLVGALVVGVAIGILVKTPKGPSGGGQTFGCDTPGDHIVTVLPGRLSCDAVTVQTNLANNGISWQASDRGLDLQIEFVGTAPFPVYCSGFVCVAGPFNSNLPSGQTEYRYRANGKLSSTSPTSQTPTPTPGVLNGRVIIIKP